VADARNPGVSHYFYGALATQHGLGWGFLILASWIVRRAWHDRPATSSDRVWRRTWRGLTRGNEATRRALRTTLLDRNPSLWLGARHRGTTLLVRVTIGGLAVLWFAGWVKWGEDWLEPVLLATQAFCLHALLKFWVASEASRTLGPHHRDGSLELLMSTPQTEREVLAGWHSALRRRFGTVVLSVGVVDAVFLMFGMDDASWALGEWVWLWVVGMGTFFLDLWALAWTGMWVGLVSRHLNRAAGNAIARVLVLPWLTWGILCFALTIDSRGPSMSGKTAFWLWAMIGVANSVLWGSVSRWRLLRRLRPIAASRYDPARPAAWWRRLSGSPASLG